MRITHGREPGARSENRTATFTGTVWADPVLAPTDGVMANTVFFSPGARTYWHRHERGQLLLVTHGRGWVQVRDGEGAAVGPGDTVWFPPGEEHWHGAVADAYLVHVAVSLGETQWLEEVAEADYAAATSA